MTKSVIDRIEYLVLLVAEFARLNKLSEVQSYRYLWRRTFKLCANIVNGKEAIYNPLSWSNITFQYAFCTQKAIDQLIKQ